MRALAASLLLFGCAEWRLPATMPLQAAGQPVVQEQVLLGLSAAGDAAVAELTDAEGAPPELTLLALDHAGGASRVLRRAPAEAARAVAQRVREAGERPTPILAAALVAGWPESTALAAELGYREQAPAVPEPGRRRWAVEGAQAIGALPLSLHVGEIEDSPRALLLLLTERPGGFAGGDEVELARMPLVGRAIVPELWVAAGTAWLLCGSVRPGAPLHRAVGLRRGSIARGEAELHNAHGLAHYGAGELDAAAREFDRAIAADPRFVDGLYNAASAAALEGRTAEAVAYLRRAAAVDPARVQVLGRDDDDLKLLRRRPDVRALLGLRRPPPGDVEETPR